MYFFCLFFGSQMFALESAQSNAITRPALCWPLQVTVTSIAVASCFLVASAVAIPTVRFFAIHMGVQMLFHLILLHLMLLPMM